MRSCAFLDRDGVLNRNVLRDGKHCAPRSIRDFQLMPGAVQAVESLRQAGYAIVVVTNQPDVGNGVVSLETANEINSHLRQSIVPDAIEMCPHRQDEGCTCRKPRPGMILRAAERLEIDLANSFMIGDRFSDVAAGKTAGCRTILVGDGLGEAVLAQPDMRAIDLPHAVKLILRR